MHQKNQDPRQSLSTNQPVYRNNSTRICIRPLPACFPATLPPCLPASSPNLIILILVVQAWLCWHRLLSAASLMSIPRKQSSVLILLRADSSTAGSQALRSLSFH
ncbi:hypothetical protein E2C01_081344 [Portunus trituberculatus]|uniref:Uncharacterized protein n=1 Tax=Portunus trituberculatus TaxID=210409 RepID=A0A5B7J223_PORTR|nr:hypothetical protein [Portunus trituberculatus]